MIRGRPINLWLGLVTAVSGALTVTLVTIGADPVAVASILGGWVGVIGAGIALAAAQPPLLNPGDEFHIKTPDGQENYKTTVATPPAADPPPVPTGDQP